MNVKATTGENLSTDEKIERIASLNAAGYSEVGVYDQLQSRQYKVMPYFLQWGNPKSEVLWRLEICHAKPIASSC